MWKEPPKDVEFAQMICGGASIGFFICLFVSRLLAGICFLAFCVSGAYLLLRFWAGHLSNRDKDDRDKDT